MQQRRNQTTGVTGRLAQILLLHHVLSTGLAAHDFSPEAFSDDLVAAPIEFAGDEGVPLPPTNSSWLDKHSVPVDGPTFGGSPIDDAPPPWTPAYDASKSTITWLAGDGDRFGMLSFESFPTLPVKQDWGIVAGTGFHFLDGPKRTDMPPRLFDFTIGVQRRELVRPNFAYDFAFRVGAFSDFEGSAKKGVRFPGHAVAFLRLRPACDLVLGVEYLDRDDISLLPVAGLVVMPTEHVRLDAVFPRPRLAVEFMDTDRWIYVSGELGGGTWAVERVDLTDDNATYRDLRLALGVEHRTGAGPTSSLEVGYVLGRKLSYRSGNGDYSPTDLLMLRSVARY